MLNERKPPLIRGTKMTCPRCEEAQDILAFVPLKLVAKYAHETVTIYKCRMCRWTFAPKEN